MRATDMLGELSGLENEASKEVDVSEEGSSQRFPSESNNMSKLVALSNLIGQDEFRKLMVTLENELEIFERALEPEQIPSGRRVFHKMLGFGNQFYFQGMAEVSESALADPQQNLEQFRSEALAAVAAARIQIRKILGSHQAQTESRITAAQ